MAQMAKKQKTKQNPPIMQKTQVQFPGSGRSPGEGNGLPTLVFLPGESHGQRSLVGYSSQESDTTEVTKHTCIRLCI